MSPTVVLIHGAFADASGWGGVITRLAAAGYTSYAPANPLRSVSGDAAYVRSFLSTIEGDVVLVGHSYGGAVITNAAVGADNVKALVYIAAFALDEGESAGAGTALGSDGPPPDLTQVVDIRPFPDAGEGNGDAYLKVEIFPQAFCQDLPAELAAVMAAGSAPRRAGHPGRAVRAARLEDRPVLVPGRVGGPGHPARRRAGHGRPSRSDGGRDRQLARRDDQPPRRGHGAHPAGDRRGRLTSGEPDHALGARATPGL